MPTLWLNRLRTRVRDQEWIKGAVNYDEDLHFSSYYLRASCSRGTGRLYQGYSCLVASYEGFNETYYLLKQECQAIAANLVSRALHKPQWLPGILAEIRRRSDALADVFPAGMTPTAVSRMTDAQLLAVYRRHDTCHRALYRYARLPEALDRGVSYFTEYLMHHLREQGLKDADANEAFTVLTEPRVPSVLAQEILEFDAIVEYARSLPVPLAPLAGGLGRAWMMLDPELHNRLQTHCEKWQFLSYHGYGRRQVTTFNDYLARLLVEVPKTNPSASGKKVLDGDQAAQAARQAWLRRLRLDRAHRVLFELYPEIGAVKLYRRYAQLRNFYRLDMILAEIARRLRVCEWAIRCLLPEEIITAVHDRRLPNYRERLDGCVFGIFEDEERVVTGPAAAELRQLLRPQPRSGLDDHALHGIVACRGKATGVCKIVIRADDCWGGVEPGTIIVSESTDPDLVPLLRCAGGVLTEQGGVTAHAAIVCRELGVPTIIGIDGLLERVHDGDWVEVDAERGIVTVTRAGKRPHPAPLPPSPETVGAKAYNLGLVRSLGFRVPDFLVFGYEEVQRIARRPGSRVGREMTQRLLTELNLSNGDKLAIRSSAFAEDQDDGSHAGEYQSLLNVRRDRLTQALRDFVAGNRVGRNGDGYQGAVIIQRMIQADCAGVCVTCDQRLGYGDAIILEMTAGGNTGVTGGTARPDRVILDRRTGDILHEQRSGERLDQRGLEVAQLVRQFLLLEAHFGKPLDIEWALAGGELYILQARPVVGRLGSGSEPGSGLRGEVVGRAS